MKRKLTMFLALFFIGIGLAVAQTQVRGTVVDEAGEPVIGATIQIKGTSQGAVSDIDGNFTLSAPADGTLVISYVGMQTQEVPVSARVNITLVADTELLEELIVTGYGTFRKSSFTGSASTMSSKIVEDAPITNIQSMMAGAIAGVKVSANAGQPGGFTSMRIRGSGSLSANNNPLYVIDGVPMFHDDISEFTYAQSGTDPMSLINPSDIEDITVVKDAAAASLYGSRAANGVVLITTKRGRAGKPVVNLKADWGTSNFAIDWRPTLSGDSRRTLLKHGFENYFIGQGDDPATAETKAENNLNSASFSQFVNKPASGWVNWKDLLLRDAGRSNYELSVRGGDQKTTYFASLGYLDNEGVSIQSQLKRYSGRVGIVHNSDRWTIDANAAIGKTVQDRSNEGTSYASPIMTVYGIGSSPAYNPFNEDGSYATSGYPLNPGSTTNPLTSAKYNFNNANLFRSTSAAKLGYRLWDNLVLSQRVSYDLLSDKEIVWWDGRSGDGLNYNGLNQTIQSEYETLGAQTQLTYNKTLNDLHNFDALAAFETEQTWYSYIYAMGYDFPNVELREIVSAAERDAETSKRVTRLMSFLGRLNYTYADKYYLSANFRNDGTSRLSSESRWGMFWSGSGAWRFSNEEFFAPLRDAISDAKIRFSYGTNGNLPNGWYAYQGVYGFTYKYAGSVGSSEESIQNNALRWEKNEVANLGLDLTLLNNRLNVILDLYNRNTKDLLYEVPISQTTGFDKAWSNIASINNKGIELDVKGNIINRNNFNWTASFNLAYNKNEVKKIGTSGDPVVDGVGIMEVGKPLYSIYVYEYAGVDPETGKESFYTNKEGKEREITTTISEAEKKNMGSVTPDITGGITNSLNYKGLDFSFVFTYSLGGQVYDYATWMQSNGGTYNYRSNIPSYYNINDMWKQPGDNAKLPAFVYGNVNTVSSRWLYSTNHLRLKNVTLGYSLPKQWLSNVGIGKVRAYVSGTNLLTFKKRDLYLDPETPINGQVTFQTPPLKTIACGIEIEF
ncbi:TonB-linked outer membrane protein, SusC/RagA family [Porphyromonadaceae bacterium KH3R12]|uniref:SusC/RagA family TonB-linked outer membrane protein n=1 Tax=Proteiniphilum saccharofermentans TaxID=1642647 RepID=UPI000896EBE7|nr:TonB-dependent receptor [Proteiniphilum saccharofermentans]SEA11467.1 TonB-linked outer membrane protein, SusC/RagA family [Porphyromonadaceae bacterium KH3R12]